MARYRLLTGKHSRFEGKPSSEPRIYRKGDVIELSAEEAKGLKGRIEPAGDAKPEEAGDKK